MSLRESTADRFHADLARREARTLDAVARRYRMVLARIDHDLNNLTAQIEAAARRGESLSTGRGLLWREQRLEQLRRDAFTELARAGGDATDLIESARFDAASTAIDQADELVRASLGGNPASPVLQITQRMPTGSVVHAIAATQPATPLTQLLTSIASTSTTAAADTLTTGIALGQNPRKIAAQMRHDMTEPLWRAERIARTEVMRAHREATRDRFIAFQDEGIVQGWTWYAQSGNCCVACLSMHGSKHTMDERLDGHPNCRCLMLPTTTSWADLGYPGIDDEPDVEQGAAIAARMSTEQLAERFGPGVANALKADRLRLSDLVERHSSPEWGTMRRRRSLKAALETTT